MKPQQQFILALAKFPPKAILGVIAFFAAFFKIAINLGVVAISVLSAFSLCKQTDVLGPNKIAFLVCVLLIAGALFFLLELGSIYLQIKKLNKEVKAYEDKNPGGGAL
jgi:hypothetical protein